MISYLLDHPFQHNQLAKTYSSLRHKLLPIHMENKRLIYRANQVSGLHIQGTLGIKDSVSSVQMFFIFNHMKLKRVSTFKDYSKRLRLPPLLLGRLSFMGTVSLG